MSDEEVEEVRMCLDWVDVGRCKEEEGFDSVTYDVNVVNE